MKTQENPKLPGNSNNPVEIPRPLQQPEEDQDQEEEEEAASGRAMDKELLAIQRVLRQINLLGPEARVYVLSRCK